MKTLKIMSIIGLVITVLSLFCMIAWNDYINYGSAIGWGMINALYGLAFGITVLVISCKKSNN